MAASNYLKTQWLKHMYGTGSFTKPSQLYAGVVVGAFSATSPLATDTGSTVVEPVGMGYARQALGVGDSYWTGTTSKTNVNSVLFPTASGNWATGSNYIIGWFIADSLTGGNILDFGSFTGAQIKQIGTGDSYFIAAGAITTTIS